jgi:hypothetical protein
MWWDIAPAKRAEWEDWHTHEHMPERLRIPGFLRGSRWVSGNSYFVLYELDRAATLTGAAYLKRLNHPTPWSRQMMPQHRNMVRSLCRVRASFGGGLSHVLGTLRPAAPPRRLRDLSEQKGLTSVHLLQSQPMPRTPQTAEQRIRGGDAQADWVVLLGGYDAKAVGGVLRRLQRDLGGIARTYALSHSLSAKE